MAQVGDFFVSYEEWCEAMNSRCNIALTKEYCSERIRALEDAKDPSTAMFIDLFGSSYRDKVVGWLERALAES
ncbi:MAG: hypothetical protein VXX36_04655 [Verrucomicrobiota bacterium]|nr:hypothetical protein [Verrucomicrobiota bacterium]